MDIATDRSKRDFAAQAQTLQIDREVQTTEGFGTLANYFTESKDGVISKQEKSFVDALDNVSKVHPNTADLQAQIQKISQENEDLLKQKQKSKVPLHLRKLSRTVDAKNCIWKLKNTQRK